MSEMTSFSASRSDGTFANIVLGTEALLPERVAERACDTTWPRLREDLRTIKIAQLLTSNGTVYQSAPVNAEACNTLKTLKIEPLPEVLRVE